VIAEECRVRDKIQFGLPTWTKHFVVHDELLIFKDAATHQRFVVLRPFTGKASAAGGSLTNGQLRHSERGPCQTHCRANAVDIGCCLAAGFIVLKLPSFSWLTVITIAALDVLIHLGGSKVAVGRMGFGNFIVPWLQKLSSMFRKVPLTKLTRQPQKIGGVVSLIFRCAAPTVPSHTFQKCQ